MNQSIKSILFLGAFVVLISLAVFLTGLEKTTETTGKQCSLDTTLMCQFNSVDTDAAQVIVKFLGKVQVEEQNQFQLIMSENLELAHAWIQGVNMYMGKIAVINTDQRAQENPDKHNLSFFIGSCSEPLMRWQLIIELDNKLTKKPERYFVNFNTEFP